jgi:uncharacterized protein YegP (UPF0339 family)
MKPKFEYYMSAVPMKRGAGKPRQDWRWHLRARNGEIVASGEGYTTLAAVRRAIRAVVRCAATAQMVER